MVPSRSPTPCCAQPRRACTNRSGQTGSGTAVVLVATGVNADGHREVLGIKAATSETRKAWNAFFADLVAWA
jgi:transposase-like protein